MEVKTMHVQQAYHVIQLALQVLGIGTVVKAIPRGIQWLYKRRQVRLENTVLSVFHNTDPDGEWHSAHGVVGKLGLKAALSDAPGFFPQKRQGLKTYLRVAFYRCRHTYRRKFIIPSKEQADAILRRLWERQLLERAGWKHTDNEFYKLRN
jgi:hypothetical protein